MKRILVGGLAMVAVALSTSLGLGCKQKVSSAVHRVVEADIANKQMAVGTLYYYVAKDDAKAAVWYRKAAEQGQADAQYAYGLCCFKGKGVAQDYVEAVKWFRKAAEQGNADGQNGLGICYVEGKGVPEKYGEASMWFRKAAEQGNAPAQLSLADNYYRGKGVQKDFVEAYKWASLPSASGDESALKWRDYLMSKMTPEQIAEGQKRAAAFVPKKSETASK